MQSKNSSSLTGKTIAVYYHRPGVGLRIRNCQSTVYPLDYNKNANKKPGIRATENFNEWALDLKESLMPAEIIMNNRLEEAKKLLNKKTA